MDSLSISIGKLKGFTRKNVSDFNDTRMVRVSRDCVTDRIVCFLAKVLGPFMNVQSFGDAIKVFIK